MDKIIFLDIDGVLNNRDSIQEGVHVLSEKCKLLKTVCRKTDAKIVISSTWRYGQLLSTLDFLLWVCGGPFKAVIGATPVFEKSSSDKRGREIDAWIKQHKIRGKKVGAYVIIDDEYQFLAHQLPFVIKTSNETGLLESDLDKIFEILS